jgi:hypothetical protein
MIGMTNKSSKSDETCGGLGNQRSIQLSYAGGQKSTIQPNRSDEKGVLPCESLVRLQGYGKRPKRAAYVVDDATGCWLWQGAINNRGYGLAWDGEKMTTAHRMMYLRYRGEVSQGFQLDHKCRNRKCCNPDHLEAVEPSVNSSRGSKAKLTDHDVLMIRYLHAEGDSTRSIAQRYSITPSYATRLFRGDTPRVRRSARRNGGGR